MISFTSSTTAHTFNTPIAKLSSQPKKPLIILPILPCDKESQVSDDEDSDSGLGENVAFAHLFPGLSQQPPALVVEIPTTVFERIISRQAIDATSDADILILKLINQNPDVNNFLTQLQIFQSINAPTAQHIKNKSDLIKTLVESYFTSQTVACRQFIMTANETQILQNRPQLAEVFNLWRQDPSLKAYFWMKKKLNSFNPNATNDAQIIQFDEFICDLTHLNNDHKTLQTSFDLLLDPNLNSSDELKKFYEFILKFDAPETVIQRVLLSHLYKTGENEEAQTIYTLIQSILKSIHANCKQNYHLSLINNYIQNLNNCVVERFYTVDDVGKITKKNISEMRTIFEESLINIKANKQLLKGVSAISPQTQYSTALGKLGLFGVNAANDVSPMAPGLAHEINSDKTSAANLDFQAEFVVGANILAGTISALWRNYGRTPSKLVQRALKIEEELAAVALTNMNGADKKKLFYSGSEVLRKAKTYGIKGIKKVVVSNDTPEDDKEFIPHLDAKKIITNFLSTHTPSETHLREFTSLMLELKLSYFKKYENLDRYNHDMNFMVFKTKNWSWSLCNGFVDKFRGTIFQHLDHWLQGNKENYNTNIATLRDIFQARFFPSADTAPVGKLKVECTVDFIQSLQAGNETQIENAFHEILYKFNADRVLSQKLLYMLDIGISGSSLNPHQKLYYFECLEYLNKIGIYGEGPLALTFVKRSLLRTDFLISTVGYAGAFSDKQITEAYEPLLPKDITDKTTHPFNPDVGSLSPETLALGPAKWIGASLMVPFMEYFSLGNTASAQSSKNIIGNRKAEFTAEAATAENENNFASIKNRKALAKYLAESTENTLTLDSIIPDSQAINQLEPPRRITIKELLKAIPKDCRQSFLEDFHCHEHPLIVELMSKLRVEDGNRVLLEDYYDHAETLVKLKARYKEQYPDIEDAELDIIWNEIPAQEKFKQLISIEKNRAIVMRQENTEFIILTAKAHLLSIEETTDAESFNECKREIMRLHESLKLLQKETMTKTFAKKSGLRAAGAAQWGLVSTVIGGTVAAKAIFGVTVFGCVGATVLTGGIFALVAIVAVLAASCALRWYCYKKSEEYNYSKDTFANKFVGAQLKSFETVDRSIPDFNSINDAAYVKLLKKSSNKEQTLHTIMRQIIATEKEADSAKQKELLLLNTERIISIAERSEINYEITLNMIDGFLKEIQTGERIFAGFQLQSYLEETKENFTMSWRTLGGALAAIGSIASTIATIFNPVAGLVVDAVTLGIALIGWGAQTLGDMAASRWNSSLDLADIDAKIKKKLLEERTRNNHELIEFLKTKCNEIRVANDLEELYELQQDEEIVLPVINNEDQLRKPLLEQQRKISNPILIPRGFTLV